MGWNDWASVLVFTTPTGTVPGWPDALRAGAFFLSWGFFHLICPILLLTALFVFMAEAIYRRRLHARPTGDPVPATARKDGP